MSAIQGCYTTHLFMFCSGCGSSIGVEAMFCSLCGMRQPVAQTLALQQAIPRQSGRVPGPLQRSYRWGQIHGALMVAVGLMLLRPHPAPVRVFMATLALVLGICVLRRNKLILPLMVAWPLAQLFLLLNHPMFPGERPAFPPLFPLILWFLTIAEAISDNGSG